ncbi:phage tail tip lysozyme [Luteipulveratus mongoliensis]|uniref:phage tail tip lysozyme n=1 Tax=Luteipulveratus mongoliensis TaxID=571913 RepID=UPI000695CBEF|nr:phage tail tip lysozyme [Luteipulveratus mongoliensis]
MKVNNKRRTVAIGIVVGGLAIVGPTAAMANNLHSAGHGPNGPRMITAQGMSHTDSLKQTAVSSNNERTAFNYFVGKGLTAKQSAGVIGNLDQESGMNPKSNQAGGPGRGIAQWSEGGRWETLKKYANKKGKSAESLGLQLDFVWHELNTGGYGFSDLKKATSIDKAVRIFQDQYEICGDCRFDNRSKAAHAAYDKYAHGGGGTKPKPKPKPGNPKPSKVYKNVWAEAPSYKHRDRSAKVGVLHRGKNYFYCQQKGAGASFAGYHNNWWLKTDDDSGNANVWVNATYVSGGVNDGKIPGVRAC